MEWVLNTLGVLFVAIIIAAMIKIVRDKHKNGGLISRAVVEEFGFVYILWTSIVRQQLCPTIDVSLLNEVVAAV